MIKPDGVQRGLIGEIIKRFEQKGYKLLAMKLTAPGKEHMVSVFCYVFARHIITNTLNWYLISILCWFLGNTLCRFGK